MWVLVLATVTLLLVVNCDVTFLGRATVNSESDSDSERRSKKWREKRRPSPEHRNKWERNRENRTGGNRRAERDEREESARGMQCIK